MSGETEQVMNCEESREQLPGLAMDALPEEEAAALTQHVSSCGECQVQLESLQKLFGAPLREWKDELPPGDLVDKTMARIAAEPKGWWAWLDRGLQRFAAHRPTWISGLVTACVAMVLFVQVLSPNWMRGRSSGSVIGCRTNLRMLGKALDHYAHDHAGQFPDHLSDLHPSYIQTFPDCPSAGSGTYGAGYKVSGDHLHYSLACHGENHKEAGLPAEQPEVVR